MKHFIFLLPLILVLIGCKNKLTNNSVKLKTENESAVQSISPQERVFVDKTTEIEKNLEKPPHYNLEDLPIKK